MNKLCIYCHAKHFLCEMNTEKCFINCCHNGKVLFNNEDLCPEQLKQLMISNNNPTVKFFLLNCVDMCQTVPNCFKMC